MVSIKFWQSINEELFKVEYLTELSQCFGNLAKTVTRSHNKRILFLSKVSKNLIETLYVLVVVYIS